MVTRQTKLVGCTSAGYGVCRGNFFLKVHHNRKSFHLYLAICIPQLPREATSATPFAEGAMVVVSSRMSLQLCPCTDPSSQNDSSHVLQQWYVELFKRKLTNFRIVSSFLDNSLIGKFVPIVLFLRSRFCFSYYLLFILQEILVTILKERETHLNLSFHYH